MIKPLKQFAVWNDDEAIDEDHGFWEYFDTVEDAVSEKGDGCEVYRFEGKLVGQFRRKVEMVRVKKRKARRKVRK